MATTGDFLMATDHNHSRYAVRQASYDLASCEANGSSTNPAEPAVTRPAPGCAYYGPPRPIRVENGLALFLVLRVPGAAINMAQREAALTRSTFRKSIANKPL